MKTLKIFKTTAIILLSLVIAPVWAQESKTAPLTWSIVASYTIPGKASGLAWDGTYIYFGIYGVDGDKIYKFDPSNGTNVLQCSGPFDDAYGLTYKSPNLVTIDQPTSSAQPSSALEFTMTGSQVSTLTLPDHYMSGIAWDNGSWWVCTYYPDSGDPNPATVYNLSPSGTVLSSFVPPFDQPWDICKQGADLWIADYYGNVVYKITTAGALIESHPAQNLKPSGIVFDGTYLWYCDGELGSNSTLYKVDMYGSGTPVITVPVTSHDYGAVPIGNSPIWNCQVQNTGTADLIITSIGIPSGEPISTTFVTPQTLPPGGSTTIPLTYTPVAAIPLNTVVSINSNDPIDPIVDVTLTGNGVYSGAHILLSQTSHDWGERRENAYSRWYLPVTNDGSQTLTITNLSMNDPHFLVDESVVLPLTVPTLGTTQIGIWFHPEEGITYNGILTITSNAVGQPTLDVTLVGSGVDKEYPVGTLLWNYTINGGYDNSPKAIGPIQDITGDSVDDLIVCSEDNYVRCLNGNASVTGDELWKHEIYSGSVYNQNCLATIDDINNDGYRDVVVGTAWGDRSIVALSGKTGLQLWKHDTHEYGDGGWVYQVDVQFDYNNDGFPDVLAATGNDGNNTGPVRVYCLNGKTGLAIWNYFVGGPVFSVIGVEDFTGDGQPDVIAGASNQQETIGKVLGIDGNYGVLEWTYNTNGSSVWGLMQIDDINNDGKKDIAAGDFSGMILFLNSVTGSKIQYLNIGNVLILRLQDMGDVNNDGHPDILVGHSGTNGIIIDGMTCQAIWSKPLADKSWCVANIGDISWDGTNDAIIGTLFQNNKAYFMDGTDGTFIKTVPVSNAVDAINAIPDIVGDSTMEMVVGDRDGKILCLSGGYDTTTTTTGIPPGYLMEDRISVKIFPNPSNGIFKVQVICKEEENLSFRLTDLQGRSTEELVNTHFASGIHEIPFDLRTIKPAGVYILEVQHDQGNIRKKIILTDQ